MRLLGAVTAALLVAPAALAAQYPTSPPPPAPLRPAQFPPFQEATLPSGLRIVLVENHEQPVVSLSLSMPAGDRYVQPGKEGLADLVAQLLTKGAGKRSAEEIAAAIEGVGGSLNAGSGQDFLTARADVLTPNVALGFELLADAVVRPTFPEAELELLRTQTLSALQLELSQPGSIAGRTFARELYGTHPYARRPTPESIRAVTRADLVAFQQARLRPGGALLVIAGDLSLADARRFATRAFAGWSGRAVVVAQPPSPPARTRREIVLVHRPGSVQSNIVVGRTSFLPADPRYYAAVVANRVLGGGAASRLFTVLREQKGWTYGAFSGLSRPRGIGAFQATAEVRTEVTDSATAELLAQLAAMGAQLVPAGELAAAKEALTGSFPLTIQTAEQIAGAVTNAILLGLPADYLRTYRTRLAAVTPAQVRAVSREIIRPESALIVVVGDAAKIHGGLAKIAPVRVVTPEGVAIDPSELTATAKSLPVNLARLVPRSDSLAIMLQGKPFGFQLSRLARTDSGFTYTETTQIGTMMDQATTLTLDASGAMRAVRQTGSTQGKPTSIEVSYAGNRAKGTASVPGPDGALKAITIDTAIVAGTLDDNAIQAMLPALPYAAGARWTFPVFASGQGSITQMTLAVTGKESVTVPAGTFEAWRVELTGGPAPVTFFVSTATPYRMVKTTVAGTPIEFHLVR
jgi:zinc protease